MMAPILALFNRALRVEARSIWTYLIRLGLVVAISFSLMTTWVSSLLTNAPGLVFFKGIVIIDVVIVLVVGIAYFSAAITEEKEEMTLGLLIMTGLSPLSLLLGKSTSRMIGIIFLLLAQFPFTLLAITLGGVSMGQVVAAYVALLAFCVFIGNLSLFCSVYCQRARSAAVMASIFFILFLFLPIIFNWLTQLMAGTKITGLVSGLSDAALYLGAMNPFTRLIEIQRTGFSGSALGTQVYGSLIAGGIFFILSYFIFNWRSREQQVAAPSRWLLGRSSGKAQFFGAGRAWGWPLMWKDFNFIVGGGE